MLPVTVRKHLYHSKCRNKTTGGDKRRSVDVASRVSGAEIPSRSLSCSPVR